MKAVLIILAFPMLLAGCNATSGDAEHRVRQLMTAWETGDTRALADIASSDVIYDDVPNGQRYEGLAGVRQYIGHVHSWAKDVRITISSVHSGRNAAFAEWVMRGVQDRPISGHVLVATNRPFELRGATLVELRDGRISRAADYLDVLGFVVQLGARVELPGGVIIGESRQPAPAR